MKRYNSWERIPIMNKRATDYYTGYPIRKTGRNYDRDQNALIWNIYKKFHMDFIPKNPTKTISLHIKSWWALINWDHSLGFTEGYCQGYSPKTLAEAMLTQDKTRVSPTNN